MMKQVEKFNKKLNRMKKALYVLTLFLFFVSAANAQELSPGMQAKNDGNDSFRNKDYVTAISNWDKYLNSGEEGVADDVNTQSLYVSSFKYAADNFLRTKDYQSSYSYFEKYLDKGGDEAKKDGEIAYKMAFCANKLDKNDVALSEYQRAIDLGYREDMSMLYIASIYKDINREDKMIETLKLAMEKYPESKNRSKMASMLTVPMLKEAAVPFNEANELAKTAATGDPNQYLENMGKAVEKFNEAIPLFKNVLEVEPDNEQASTYLKNCEDNISAFNTYKDNLQKK
jgi:tetratricopeptide (TPR) repeat protein